MKYKHHAKKIVKDSSLCKAHTNVATQIRNLFRDKLPKSGMPELAAHLKAYLHLHFPSVLYIPPTGSCPWRIENPSA